MPYRLRIVVGLLALVACVFFPAVAQDKSKPAPPVSTCSRESAVSIIDRQIDLTRTIDQDPKRIPMLMRAADLLWPLEQEKARATFSDAFELARRDFKNGGAKDTNFGRSIVGGIDYRYRVITAIARRDPVWAKKLSKQILDEQAQEAVDKTQKNSGQTQTASNLLGIAMALVPSQQTTAVEFARSSLQYPATLTLPRFFFKLWEANPTLADQFYVEALNAYAQAPMEQFLYLSSYPLAANREIGDMPAWTIYTLPAGIAPNPVLERSFVTTLLGRARDLAQNPASAEIGYRFSDLGQILMALTRLEPLIADSLPDLSAALATAKSDVAARVTQPEQQLTAQTLADPPKRSFDETIESADRLAGADDREGRIALAILKAAETESLEKLDGAGMKIEDLELRKQVMSLTYVYRVQKLTKDKKLDEARRLAARVEEVDQRAYLYGQIATESIKQKKDDSEVREMLEDVLSLAAKAPNSEVKVRAMLVVVHLYSTIDPNRAVALLGRVVETINHLESVELSGDRINVKVEGKAFGWYGGLQTPGFSPEVVFREMGKLDFDGTLYLASNLSDKSVRGMTTLSIAEQCLQDLPPPPKPNKTAPSKPN
jgi:hypothetical protein